MDYIIFIRSSRTLSFCLLLDYFGERFLLFYFGRFSLVLAFHLKDERVSSFHVECEKHCTLISLTFCQDHFGDNIQNLLFSSIHSVINC